MYDYDIIQTQNSVKLKVYVQGNVEERSSKTVFLTVHDVGMNGRSFIHFVDSNFMTEVKKKSLWFHVVLPGQDEEDDTIPANYNFPSMDDIAKDLAIVLDAYKIKGTIIGFGEGAGANILLRFGLMFPNRCLGLILIDCTSSCAGFDEQVLCKMYNWKEDGAKLWHKMINTVVGDKLDQKALTDPKVNSVNIGRYLDAYMKRDDISPAVAKELSVDTVLISGSRSPYAQDAYSLNHLNCRRTTVLVLDDTMDVIAQAPKNLARALILFCKGVGVLTSVPLLGLEKEFKRVKEKQALSDAELQLVRNIQMHEDLTDLTM